MPCRCCTELQITTWQQPLILSRPPFSPHPHSLPLTPTHSLSLPLSHSLTLCCMIDLQSRTSTPMLCLGSMTCERQRRGARTGETVWIASHQPRCISVTPRTNTFRVFSLISYPRQRARERMRMRPRYVGTQQQDVCVHTWRHFH